MPDLAIGLNLGLFRVSHRFGDVRDQVHPLRIIQNPPLEVRRNLETFHYRVVDSSTIRISSSVSPYNS
jgi:hypothetical protein